MAANAACTVVMHPAFRGFTAVANDGWTSTPVVCFAQSALIAQES